MNIVFVVEEFPPNIHGGLGRYADAISKAITAAGNHLWVYALNSCGVLPEVNGSPPRIVYRPLRRRLRQWFHGCKSNTSSWRHLLVERVLNRLCFNLDAFQHITCLHSKVGLDVICVHDWMSSLSGILCAIFTRVPVVFHVHNTEFSMTPWGKSRDKLRIITFLERLLVKLCHGIVVFSPEMRAQLIQHGWSPKKIYQVHYGYDHALAMQVLNSPETPDRISLIRQRLRLDNAYPVLVFVGRFVYAKGVFTLVKAIGLLKRRYPDVRLIMLGRGDDQLVRDHIRELNLEQNVHSYFQFLSHDDVFHHYMMADICIFPSIYEPFGMVALESMSLAKPTVLGKGFSTFIAADGDRRTAIRIEEDSPDVLATAIQILLEDPETARAMGAAAQRFVRETFNWDKSACESLAVYESVIRQNAIDQQ